MKRLFSSLIVAGLLVGACGDDADSDSDASDADASASGSASGVAAEDGAFPVTVEHEHGETELTEAPERVVTLGFSDQDYVLAFGVVPVAITHWYDDAVWPWAQDELEALGDEAPVVMNEDAFTGVQAFNFEQIAELDPDLIIGLYTGMTEEEYETLSAIAPTVAPSGEYPEYGMPWDVTTRTVGAALGQPERADELVTEVEGLFDEAAAAHPEFDGLEMVVAEQFEPGSSFARSATDPRTVFMTSLGFVLPDDIAELAGDLDGAPISDEQMALLDRDFLLWNVGHDLALRDEIESKPLHSQLAVVQEGRELFIEDPLVSGALTWATVLSLPYAIEHLVPEIAEVLG